VKDNTKVTLTIRQLKKLVREGKFSSTTQDDLKVYPICEGYENSGENIDMGDVIGTFVVEEETVNEMGSIGEIRIPHLYYVYIHPNEGANPHFHVFDKAGMHRNKKSTKGKKGFHTCVAIKCNKYFKHGPYTDDLDRDMMSALDKFMGSVRTDEDKPDVGLTNFVHTIKQWNANNAPKGTPGWVDTNIEKPDYTIVSGNL